MKGLMSKSHELDHDRLSDTTRTTDPTRAPARGTRAQDLTGPTGPLRSGIVMRKQRDANGVSPDAEDHLARVSAAGGGRALPDGLRNKFEQSLGADLSSVRVHDGADSAASANAFGAKAYTLGNDIHFGAGHYDPTSAAGEHLLAHEVAHTVQQAGGAGKGAQFKLEVSSAGDAHEVEADRAADAMVSGARASVSGAVGLARKIMREEAENKGGVSFGTSSKGSHISIKREIPIPPLKAKFFSLEPAGVVEVEGELEVKGKGEAKAGSDGESAAHESDGPSDAERAEATEQGGEALAKSAPSEVQKQWDASASFDPQVEVGTGGNGSADLFTFNLLVFGHPITIKASLLDVKEGQLKGPSATISTLVLPLGESTLWENARLELKVKKQITLEMKVRLDYVQIGKVLLEQAVKHGLIAAGEDTITTGAAAAGADLAFAAGMMTIPAAMVWGWKKAIDQAADRNGAIDAGKARIDDIVDSAMRGLIGGQHDDQVSAVVSSQFHTLCIAKYNELYKAHKDGGVSIEEYQQRAAEGAKENAAQYKTMFTSQVAPQVATQYAQAYYDAHKGDFQTDAATLHDAQEVFNKICGGSPDAFHPGDRPTDPAIALKAQQTHAAPEELQADHDLAQAQHANSNAIQREMDPARTRAYSAGNRLYKWIKAQPNPEALEYHNEGTTTLRKAEEDAAQVHEEADMNMYGKVALDGFTQAALKFEKGLALYPASSPPGA